MDDHVFAAISGPISFSAIVLNIVFSFCLLCPPSMQVVNVQQPLKVLLVSMVMFSFLHQTTIMFFVCQVAITPFVYGLYLTLKQLFYFTNVVNLSSVTWLSILYYINIVPNNGQLFIWIKRRIKNVVYFGLVLDRGIVLTAGVLDYVSTLRPEEQPLNSSSSFNVTAELSSDRDVFFYLGKMCTVIYSFHLLISFGTMILSWSSTYIYLRRHMKRMEESSSSFSQPQLQSQMRVTVTGLVQAALFFPYCLLIITLVVTHSLPGYNNFDPNDNIQTTVSSLFGLCSSVCLGFSQSVFRQRVISLLEGVFKQCNNLNG